MRYLSLIILFAGLTSLDAQTVEPFSRNDQQKWARGTVYFADGRQANFVLRLLVSFNEGALQVKSRDEIHTLSPQRVDRFVYYDSSMSNYREFYSIDTKFSNRKGHKLVFQELLYEGGQYSLYRRYLPDSATSGIIVPSVGWAVWSYGRIKPALFIRLHDDKAYQVTTGITNLSKRPAIDRLNYNLDRQIMKLIFGDNWKSMVKYVRENNVDIQEEKGMIAAIKHLEGSSFQYNRKETPKKIRH